MTPLGHYEITCHLTPGSTKKRNLHIQQKLHRSILDTLINYLDFKMNWYNDINQ